MSKTLKLGCSIQAELMLNLFAVGLDCFPAKVELLGNFPRAVCSAQQLKDLHLAIRQPLNSLTRRGWFFTQCPLNYRCGDALTEIQLAREDLARCSQYLISGVFFHDIPGGACAKGTLGEEQLIVLRENKHIEFRILDLQCFDEVQRVARLQPKIENH